MMFVRCLFLAAILLMVSTRVMAADLLEVFRTAQTNDSVFAAARATRQAGLEKLPQGRALLLPNISVTANSTLNDQTIQSAGIFSSGNSRYNSHNYSVNLIQPLFRQQSWLAYSASELQVVQSEVQFKVAEQDLVLRVAQAYFDVLIAQDNVRLVELQKRAIAEQLQQARHRFEIGSATITDTHEAQARFDLTAAQGIAASNNLELKRYGLQQLTNVALQNFKPLGESFKLEMPQPTELAQWVAMALQGNLQLKVAQIGVELAQKEAARIRGGHYPTVDLVATYSNNVANGGVFGVGSDTTNKTVGIQLNLPLFQGGLINSQWREAKANQERARQELENTRRTISLQVRQAYLGVVNGIAQVKALRQALISSESVLAASKLGQEVGVRTNLDVLNAQEQLHLTQRDLFQAQYGYLISQLQLEAMVGTLSADDLARVNQSLY
jgi:outer membrane protein